MNYKAKLLVCCHKKDIMANREPYFPIQLGKSLTDIEFGITPDNTGDNISYKNNSYCELTGIYWAWKDFKDTDIIGLCHYRRYFDFHGNCQPYKPYTTLPTSSFQKCDLSIPNNIFDEISKGKIILPRKENYPISVLSHFNNGHSCFDMYTIKDIIKKNSDDKYSQAFWNTLVRGNKMHTCNMFIMNWENFDSYCRWLFPILEEAEKRIDLTSYSQYQQRLYGFLAERLLNVWVYAENKSVKEYPMLFFSDDYNTMAGIAPWKYRLGCFLNNILNFTRIAEYKFHFTNII